MYVYLYILYTYHWLSTLVSFLPRAYFSSQLSFFFLIDYKSSCILDRNTSVFTWTANVAKLHLKDAGS